MKITKWRIQDYLKTPKDVANYLESSLEDLDIELKQCLDVYLNKDSFIRIAVKDAIKALKKMK